ncbi:hypothetical protein GCM10020331_082800 [Ectobacillus funiculus]
MTNMINNAMAAGGALTAIDPEMTQKADDECSEWFTKRQSRGFNRVKKVGILDLMKVLKDPDINRAIGFGLNLLKGIGEGLKE